MTNSLGDFFYSVVVPDDWATYTAGWASDVASNALRYTRDGTRHQLSGQLKFTNAAATNQNRNYGTVVSFAPFATFANPLGNVSYDTVSISTGLQIRWILAGNGALSLYRPTAAAWTLPQNEVFPINMNWLAPPGDPDYGLGPAFKR